MNFEEFAEKFAATVAEVGRAILGQKEVVESALIALLSGGHILIEGVPGLGKTLLVRSLAQVLGVSFGRIQFTPDLMPSDITGGNVFNAKRGEFEFIPGPIFEQLVLADEINRAPAKTQSALLEAMQERSVTVDGNTRDLTEPFLVLATQNPVESQGTYPLPEAQLDRFLLKIHVDYPKPEVEHELLEAYVRGFDPQALELRPVLTVADLKEMKQLLTTVNVDSPLLAYMTRLVTTTRNHRNIYVGASPRATIGLLMTARARAASEGRDFVVPDDVKSYASGVLRHRLVLHPDTELEGISADEILQGILDETPVPGGVF